MCRGSDMRVAMRPLDEYISGFQFLAVLLTTVFIIPFLTLGTTLDPALPLRFLAWGIMLFVLCLSFLLPAMFRTTLIDYTLGRRVIFPVFLGYFLFSAVSLCRAVNLTEGIYEVLKLFMSVFFLLVATTVFCRRNGYVSIFIKSVVVSSALLALIGFYQYFKYGAVEKPGFSLLTGTMGQKNLFASALFLMLPFCWYAVLAFRDRWRLVGIVPAAAIPVLILVSETRAVWLALFVATAVTALVAGALIKAQRLEISAAARRRFFRTGSCLALGFLLLGLPVAVVYLLAHAPGDMGEAAFSRDSLAQRLSVWRQTLELIRDHPLVGVGAGNWRIVFPSYGVPAGLPAEWLQTVFFIRPHNDFLWVLSEVGVVGFLLYVLTFALAVGCILRTVVCRRDAGDTLLLLLMLLGIVGYVVVACFCFPRERVFHSMLLLSMMAIVISRYHQSFAPPAGGSRVWVMSLFLLALVLLPCAVVVGYLRLAAEVHTKRALAARRDGDWATVVAEIDRGYSLLATLDPMSTPLQWYRGEANFLSGNISGALEDYTKALEAHPYHTWALSNLATCHELQGNHDEAVRYYEEALRIQPQFREALANLVAAHFNCGQYEKARAALLRYDPRTHNATLERYQRILTEKLEAGNHAASTAHAHPLEPGGDGGKKSPGVGALRPVYQLWSSVYGRYYYTIDDTEEAVLLDSPGQIWTCEGIAYYAFVDGRIPGLRPVQRFYSADLNTHFYTIAPEEAKSLTQGDTSRWKYEGTAFYAFPDGCQPAGTTPVYRLWSRTFGYHYFTVDEEEVNRLRTEHPDAWTYEGVAWFVYR